MLYDNNATTYIISIYAAAANFKYYLKLCLYGKAESKPVDIELLHSWEKGARLSQSVQYQREDEESYMGALIYNNISCDFFFTKKCLSLYFFSENIPNYSASVKN